VVQETDWLESLPLQSHNLFEFLSHRGHEVRVIDYEAKWKPVDFTASLRGKDMPNASRTDSRSSITLIRPGMVKLPGLSRVSAAALQFKEIFRQTIKWCDIVVMYSVPTNGIQTILSAKLANKPILFHSFDILHRMTGNGFLVAPTWTLERFVYRHVDKLVVISSALEKYVLEIGVPPGNVELLPPGVNMDRFNRDSPPEFREKIGLSQDDKVVLFSGWLYDFCGLDMILKSWSDLSEAVPGLKLVICGDGPLLEPLRRFRDENYLTDDVVMLGRRPFDQMPSIIATADLCINPYLPEVRSNFAFPSKIPEYMAMGKPVLATDLAGTRSLLPPDSGVRLVDPKDFVSTMKDLLVNDRELECLGQACNSYCEKAFSLHHVSDRFERIIAEIVAKRNHNLTRM
jgi:glycosyltransferase involved in cell wall biosynthesis